MEIAGLTRVATYCRTVRASVQRVWENVHDWEHLPWLHGSSFCGIELLDSGDWGWRVNLDLPPVDAPRRGSLELVIDAPNSRYVSRMIDGVGKGSEIWTTVTPTGPETTDIEVEFHLADVNPTAVATLGALYMNLYARLWDEDEQMMRHRAALLVERPDPIAPLEIGPEAEVRAHAPLEIEFGGRPVRVDIVDGSLRAYSTVCPHWFGPLSEPDANGVLVCPWHGYRFDLRAAKSCDGRRLRMLPAPRLEIDPETSTVTLTPDC